jgi:hypothetical protein
MTNHDLQETLNALLDPLAGVGRKKAFGHDSFVVGKKVFLFIHKDGIVLKLPGDRIRELIGKKQATFLVMGKRTMKEWAVLPIVTPAAAKKALPLFKESRDFVASGT